MEKEKISSLLENVIKLSIYVLLALVPLFFLPSAFITHELPKQFFLILLIGIGFVAWLLKLAVSPEIKIRRSLFDIIVLAFWAIQAIATIGSISTSTSIWGFFGRGNLSLATTSLLASLYFLVVNNIYLRKDIYRLLIILISSSAVVVIIALLQIASILSFNTIGSLNSLVLYLIPILAIVITLLLPKKGVLKLSLSVLGVTILGVLLSLNVTGLWWGVIVSLLIIAIAAAVRKDINIKWLFLPATLIILALIMLFSQNFGLKINTELPLDKKTAWQETKATVKYRPAFGSGPESFIFDFSKYRPKKFNDSPLWQLRFDRANNDYFTVLATSGILGFLAYLALLLAAMGFLVSYIIKEKDGFDSYIGIAVLSAIGALVINSFISYTNTASSLLLWTFIALANSLRFKDNEPQKLEVGAVEGRVFTILFLTLGTILIVSGIYSQGRALAADIAYRKGLTKSAKIKTLNQGLEDLKRATKLNSSLDVYRVGLAKTLIVKANIEAKKKKPDVKALRRILSEAISNSQRAIGVSPINVANWEALATVYRNASLYVSGALPWVERGYTSAIGLEPTNPLLYNGLGQVFLTQKQYDKAKQVFSTAIKLKEDLVDSHFNLGLTFKAQKKYAPALAEFNKVLKLQPLNESAKKEIRNLKKKLRK